MHQARFIALGNLCGDHAGDYASRSSGPVRARLYLPGGVAHPPGMVVAHGIHHLGIDEPRLMSFFARGCRRRGCGLLTPEIDALADYHVDAASMATIGESPGWLQQRLGTGPVTVVGVSFAGSLSLLAACDPRYASHIRALVLMAPTMILGACLAFLLPVRPSFPMGERCLTPRHDYGAAVLCVTPIWRNFSPKGIWASRTRRCGIGLWEQPQDAQKLLARLSPAGRATMELLLARQN